jgi:hypothetical protein
MKQEPPEGRRSTTAARRESPGSSQGRRQLDIDGLVVAQRAVIDRLAREAGRDPSVIDAVLRVNVDPDTPSRQIADAPKAVHERTGIGHFMIDSMFAVHSVDAAIGQAAELIALAEKG